MWEGDIQRLKGYLLLLAPPVVFTSIIIDSQWRYSYVKHRWVALPFPSLEGLLVAKQMESQYL
jgi:hypothetical protein